jgi:hypothetical protein
MLDVIAEPGSHGYYRIPVGQAAQKTRGQTDSLSE